MLDRYELEIRRVKHRFSNIKATVTYLMNQTNFHSTQLHWSLYDLQDNGYIYGNGADVKTLSSLEMDSEGYNEDNKLRTKYRNVLQVIINERSDDYMDRKPTIQYVNDAEWISKMGIKEKDKKKIDETWNFFIFGRDLKVHTAKGIVAFLAWHRNRSANKTKRGIRLRFNQRVNKVEDITAHISTVFCGAIPKNETDLSCPDEKYPPLFETLVFFEEDSIFQLYRYNNYTDAMQGHAALLKENLIDLKESILLEQSTTKDNLAYVK